MFVDLAELAGREADDQAIDHDHQETEHGKPVEQRYVERMDDAALEAGKALDGGDDEVDREAGGEEDPEGRPQQVIAEMVQLVAELVRQLVEILVRLEFVLVDRGRRVGGSQLFSPGAAIDPVQDAARDDAARQLDGGDQQEGQGIVGDNQISRLFTVAHDAGDQRAEADRAAAVQAVFEEERAIDRDEREQGHQPGLVQAAPHECVADRIALAVINHAEHQHQHGHDRADLENGGPG